MKVPSPVKAVTPEKPKEPERAPSPPKEKESKPDTGSELYEPGLDSGDEGADDAG